LYYCSNCGKELPKDIVINGRVSRGDTCPFCHSYLKCCLNCTFYSPGYHNDCREPQAELVADKRSANFCEYFKYREGPPLRRKNVNSEGAKDAFKRLFGD